MEGNSQSEPKQRIIVVEHSEEECDLLTQMLGEQYDYCCVHDGDTLLNLLADGEPADMILLDTELPNLRGMEVLKVMYARHWTEEIPTVVILSDETPAVIQNACKLGSVDYISRPFHPFVVKHRISATLTQYANQKQLARYAKKQVLERERINNILINLFGNLVELHNSESGEHTMHVQKITKMILKRLPKITNRYSFSQWDIELISTLSALHDIGKAFIPAEILNKPGKLTPEEWEIMKSHTVLGDEFLQKTNASPTGPFMTLAREIVRSHHERYDGRGYPDGLVGEEIPISAQVVAIADVYDALTSDRCYKKAYPHETAIEMIKNGECGAFNPLLIRCLTTISDELLVNLKINSVRASYGSTAPYPTVFGDSMRMDERADRLLAYESEKKRFFADRCCGIQFEYDAERRKVTYLTHYDEQGDKIYLSSETVQLLNDGDLAKLTQLLSGMTRQNNTVTLNVLIPIGGDTRWHRLTVKSIWSKSGGRYRCLVGQFTDIHDSVLQKSMQIMINGHSMDNEGILAMRAIFDMVRLVDPTKYEVMKIIDGALVYTGQKCYHFWGRSAPCQNCISCKATEEKRWVSKFEMKEHCCYSVVAKGIHVDSTECALEVAYSLNNDIKLDSKVVGYTAIDISILQKFYRDTVTETYSRAYLDKILPEITSVQAVAVIDVDNFKSINDTYGHAVGDSVLRQVAKQVKSQIHKRDTLIRYGGDEFVLVFFDVTEQDFFAKLAEIKQTVASSVFEEQPELSIGISIGGVYGVSSIAEAIDAADKEMYKDKFGSK